MDDLHNPAPFLDVVAVIEQIKANQQTFQQIGAGASPKKIVDQVTPQNIQIPYCGVSVEFGDVSENYSNTTTVQQMEVIVSCTCIYNAPSDFTGAGQQITFMDSGLKDLMHSLYNWQPSTKRYLNGFRLLRFERIAELSQNDYEVYVAYFIIPMQIDMFDGYLDEPTRLREIQTKLLLNKGKDTNLVSVENISTAK
ncbi:hypothetical protein HKD28_15130 [Gluconobacter sp. LMG 1744]|uniref:hypothetical protein n=1 Tax=Gluconobacter cadivus TaxID=2728101 RepID=UPI001884C10D|nr:hypothetical protein [Gluconobacter cadivus]MBF0892724.1 hypothetical protein [Gluconobacter cadivus]